MENAFQVESHLLAPVWGQLQSRLQAFAHQDDFAAAMAEVYGAVASPDLAAAWQAGELGFDPARIRLTAASELNGHSGAFVAETGDILLAADRLLQPGGEALLERVLLEEFGHWLDGQLNPGRDSAGDEGEAFADLVTGTALSAADWQALRQEDDHGQVVLDGRRVGVEFTHIGDDDDDGDAGADIAVLPPPSLDPAQSEVAPRPPGPDTGPVPVGFAAYTTLANGMPVLHSRPGAPTSIFLDFDGDSSGSNPYTATVAAYDEDGNAASFSLGEQRNIWEAWREVSAYFAIFDINVTTVFDSKPKAWLCVGNNISGGYSYVNVFPNTTPESWNQSGDARTRVSGLTHELGHNFGLQHQASWDQWGVKTAEYASAIDPYHGLLMGIDYGGKVHKFILGHNSTSSGATSLQDDIAIIASKIKPYQGAGGDGFRLDDQLWDPTKLFSDNISLNLATPLTTTAQASQWASAILERPGDVDGFSFTSTGGRYALCATPDVPSGVDLKLEIYDASGKLLAASDGANNNQQLSIDLDAGTYCALVSSHGNYGDLGSYFLSASLLPAGWRSTDIGTAVSGYTVYDTSPGSSPGSFSLVGSGLGLTSSADEVQVSYQSLSGDGTIVARITNVDNTSANALVGVTMRESTAANARHVSVVRTYSGGPRQFSRASTGGSTSSTAAAGTAGAHTWLMLQRAGNTFTTFTSSDGVSWSQLGSTSITMASTITVGLVGSSNNIHALNVGAIDNVVVTGNTSQPAPSTNGLAAPANLAVVLGTGSGLNLAWDAVSGASGYAVSRSADGLTFSQIGTTAGTTYSDPNLTGSARYFYRVSATDAAGSSTPSAVVSLVNRPSAVTGLRLTKPSLSQLVLDWTETTGETGYRVQRSSDGGSTYTTVATLAANVPSYTDSGLTSGQAYSYIVTPTSALGDGVASAVVSGAPRLAAVSPSLGPVASGSVTLNWGDLSNESGYRIERSSDGTSFTSLATVGANVLSYVDTTAAAATEVYYRVFGTTSLTQSLVGSVKFAAAPSTSAPPAPWSSADIGAVSGPGTTDLSNGTFKLISSGSSIGGTSDTFRLTSQPLVGDGSVVARVASIENTASSARAGVMVRQSSAANAANAYVYVTPTTIGFSYRATAGGSTTTVATAALTAPNWVKLSRVGNAFSAFYSADGVSWTQLGAAVTIAMTSSTVLGLAATAGSTTALNTATLSNVAVSVPFGLSVSDVTQVEGNPGSSHALAFTVNLSAAAASTVVVDYATANGTATAGSDFSGSSGTLTFQPGELSKTVTVAISGDLVSEGNETLALNLTNASGAALLDAQGIGTIQDDDTAGISVTTPTSATTTEAGGTSSFDVALTSQPLSDVTVTLTSGTPSEGAFNSLASTELLFTPSSWNVAQSVTVTGVDDSVYDGDPAYAIVFSATSGDSNYDGRSRPSITLTNLDDETPPPPPLSRFYIENDGSPDQTFEYSDTGAWVTNYAVSTANTAPRGAVRVDGPTPGSERVLVLDKNRNVYVYDDKGVLQGSWLAGTIASSASVEGIASDGTNVWIVDSKADKVFYYANGASRTTGTQAASSSTSLAAGNANAKDLVYGVVNGVGSLWIVNDASADTVYRYQVTGNGGISLASSWALASGNAAPTGITLDPSSSTGDLWVLDNGTSKRVFRYAGAQGWTGGAAPAGAALFTLATANANPQAIAMSMATAPAILAPGAGAALVTSGSPPSSDAFAPDGPPDAPAAADGLGDGAVINDPITAIGVLDPDGSPLASWQSDPWAPGFHSRRHWRQAEEPDLLLRGRGKGRGRYHRC